MCLSDLLPHLSLSLCLCLQCPLDSRRPLAASLVVVGGTAQLPGLKARLLAEVVRQAALPPYSDSLRLDTFKVHRPPAKDNYLTWLGGMFIVSQMGVMSTSVFNCNLIDML